MKRIGGVAIMLLAMTGLSWGQDAGPVFTPYGMGMYRLRFEYLSVTRNDSTFSAGNYQNRLAYRVGLRAKINEQVSGQFEVGNDWFATEEVTGIPGNYFKQRNPWTPWFSLAYMQWNPGYLNLQAGIVPVKGSALMDLIGFSIRFNRTYGLAQDAGSWGAAHIPWGVVTNFGMAGMRLGAPIVKGDFSLGADLFTTVLEQRLLRATSLDFELNGSAVMFVLDVPMSYKGLTLTAQFVPILNRNFVRVSGGDDKSDIELGVGLDGGYKLSEQVSLRGGIGTAMLSNENTWNADTVPVARYERSGFNGTVGVSLKAGPGKLDFDFCLSTADNAQAPGSKAMYPFVDLKYGWGVAKNFTIMPRVRVFDSRFDDERSTTTVWPELMLFGAF